MSITLNDLHAPLEQFFTELFDGGADGPIAFRFDRFGSVISDDDFRAPSDPSGGYSPALAQETFSALVNRAPVGADDGVTVALAPGALDEFYYYRLVLPALARAVDGGESAEDVFTALKAEAVRQFENQKAQGILSLDQYRPCQATPVDWYDATATANWTSHSIDVASTDDPPPDPTAPTPGLWRSAPPAAVLDHLDRLVPPVQAARAAPTASAGPVAPSFTRLLTRKLDTALAVAAPRRAAAVEPAEILPTRALRVEAGLARLPLADRAALLQQVAETAPTEPVAAPGLHIAFEYCIVGARRAWWFDPLLQNTSWYSPGVPLGSLTDPAVSGAVGSIPVGMVVVRQLAISAAWTDGDRAAAAGAVSLGPFTVDGMAGSGQLTHDGIQCIGWLLQSLPPLPPCEPPAASGPENKE